MQGHNKYEYSFYFLKTVSVLIKIGFDNMHVINPTKI